MVASRALLFGLCSLLPTCIRATQCEVEAEESVHLQVVSRVGRSDDATTPGQVAKCGPTFFMSILASGAQLKIEKSEEGGENSVGSLTMTGNGVEKALIMADRPVRMVSEVKTEKMVSHFNTTFSAQTGGFPNAVLSGKVKDGGMKEVALVLVEAEYSAEGPTLTWKWRSDDDVILDDLNFEFASLVVDSFWHDLKKFFCKVKHAKSVIEHALCTKVAGKAIKEGVKKGFCTAEDLEGAGLCAAVDAEDDELSFPLCEALLVKVCAEIVTKIGEGVAKDVSGGKVSIGNACNDMGYHDPCA